MSDFLGWQTTTLRRRKVRCRKCGRKVRIAIVRFDADLSRDDLPALCTNCFRDLDPLEGRKAYRREDGEVVIE